MPEFIKEARFEKIIEKEISNTAWGSVYTWTAIKPDSNFIWKN